MDEIFKLHKFDIVQASFNVIDRRLLETGWLAKLKRMMWKSIVVHAFYRAFAYGQRKIPAKFYPWGVLFDEWHNWFLDNRSITKTEVCLAFVKSFQGIDRIIVGVDNKNQLENLVAGFAKNVSIDLLPNFSNNDLNLINPSKWNLI